MSSEEAENLPKTTEKDDQSIKDPFESDLNTMFQTEEDLITEKQAFLFPSQTQHCKIPDHSKSIIEKCGIILVWVHNSDFILFFQPIILKSVLVDHERFDGCFYYFDPLKSWNILVIVTHSLKI